MGSDYESHTKHDLNDTDIYLLDETSDESEIDFFAPNLIRNDSNGKRFFLYLNF